MRSLPLPYCNSYPRHLRKSVANFIAHLYAVATLPYGNCSYPRHPRKSVANFSSFALWLRFSASPHLPVAAFPLVEHPAQHCGKHA
jgi:hypothetical protein